MAILERAWSFGLRHKRWLRGTWEVLLEVAAVGLIVVAILWFFRENIANNTVYWENDTRVFYYPVMADLAKSIQAGRLTLWSPYLLNGFPFFADGEAGALYPFNYLLLSRLPIEQAFVWLMVIRFILASVFMYAYSRSLSLARTASWAAAAVFGFGGFSVAQLHHMNLANSAAWLPLILFFFELAMRTKGYLRYSLVVLAGIALGISSVGVHVQVMLMILLFLGLYVPFRIFLFSWLPPRKTTARRASTAVSDDQRATSLAGPVGESARPPRPTGTGEGRAPEAVAKPVPVFAVAVSAGPPGMEKAETLSAGATEAFTWRILDSSDDGVDEPAGLSASYVGFDGRDGDRALPRLGRRRRHGAGGYALSKPEHGFLPRNLTWTNPRELAYGLGRLGEEVSRWLLHSVLLVIVAVNRSERWLVEACLRSPQYAKALGRRFVDAVRRALTPANLFTVVSHLVRAVWYLLAVLVRKSLLAAWAGPLLLFVGLGLAAAQLLPEYELGNFSYRAGAVPYSYAVTYAMSPFNLITLLFPFFFRDVSGRYWGLWSGWETAIYVGIMPLLLALIAVICARTRRAFFFGGVAVASLFIALGDYIPWNLHRWLYELPGFDQMRAPARFSLLFLFSMASLTGIAVDWMIKRLVATQPLPWLGRWRRRSVKSRPTVAFSILAISAVPVGAALPFALNWATGWMQSNRDEALKLIAERYLKLRNIGFPMKPDEVFGWLLSSLSLDNKKVVVTVALIIGSALVLLFWDRFRRVSFLWQLAVVGVIVLDLYLFAKSFHPIMPVEALAQPSAAMAFLQQQSKEGRAFTVSGAPDQPNRLSLVGVEDFSGYSSLQFQRHAEYAAHSEMIDNRLLDVANVRYVLRSTAYTPLPSYKDTQFNPLRPLLLATSLNASSTIAFTANGEQATEVRVVGNLSKAVDIPQGAKIGQMIVTDVSGVTATVDLKAGTDFSEAFYDRPDIAGKVKHAQTEVAHRFSSLTDAGTFMEQLYYSALWISPAGKPGLKVKRVEFHYTYPVGTLRIHGVCLYDTLNWKSKNLRRYDKENYKLVYQDDKELVYENLSVLPRAFLVPTMAKVKSNMAILWRMAEGDFDPEKTALLEIADRQVDPRALGVPEWVAGTPVKTGKNLGTARVVDSSRDGEPEKVVVQVDAAEPSLLYLADSYYPGWNAYVDGRKEDVYRANYLFRAAYVPPGQHTVEFRFEPGSYALGESISLWVLPIAAGSALAVFSGSLAARGVLWSTRRAWRRLSRAIRSARSPE